MNQVERIIESDRIPDQLKNRTQWLNWRIEVRDGGKPTKVPYQTNGKHAKSNDPTTWNDLNTCLDALTLGKFDGIGFAFSEGDQLVGIDLDHCFDGARQLEAWAQEVLDLFPGTYVEQSPSADGLHVWCKGRAPKTGSRKWKKPGTDIDQGLEVYDASSPRYFTVTGSTVTGTHIIDSQSGLDRLHEKYFAETYEVPSQARSSDAAADQELVKKALEYIPADEYTLWIEIGMALKAAAIDFALFDEWSAKSSKYDRDTCLEKWSTFNGNRLGLGTIFHHAKQNGFQFAKRQDLTPPDWTSPDTFGEPLLFGRIDTPDLSPDFLPVWVREYVEALAANTQAPRSAVAVLALSVLAACIQKRYEVSPYGDDYTEPLSLWTLVALPPASRKTALLEALRAPIVEWERAEALRLGPLMQQQTAERKVMTERIKRLEREAARLQDEEEGDGETEKEED